MQELAKLITKTSSQVRKHKTYNEVVNNLINKNKWLKAIDEELWNLNSYQIWCYTILTSNCKPIGHKQVFKIKYYSDKFVKKYKAKIVPQSFLQMHGIDYTETFALTIRRETLRIFLAIAIILRITLLEIDIIGAYLESFLGQTNQSIYIKILQKDRNRQERLVCKILKSLYGLK